MKTFKEIENKINENRDKIAANNARIKELESATKADFDKLVNIYGFCGALKSEEYKKIKAQDEENAPQIENIKRHNELLEILVLILEENAKAAYISETLPEIVKTFTKYNGKPYGPKTKEAIKEEIKKALNISVYADADGKKIGIVPLNNEGYSYGVSYEVYAPAYDFKYITPENKINGAAFENAPNPYKYTEEPGTAALEVINAKIDAIRAYKAAKAAADKYNELKPDTMKYLQIDSNLYRIF